MLIIKNLKFSFVFLFLLFTISSYSQVPMNWNRDEINPGEDFTLSPDDSFFSEGLKSCHLQLNSSAVPYLVSDVFYVTPGADYQFSFDVFDNDTAGQVKVYADFYDTYGFNVFGQPPVFSADSSEWQTINWQGIVPGQAVVGYVLIKFYSEPDLYNFTKTASIWMDNIRFRQDGGDNLVANGSFEEWIVGVDEIKAKDDMLAVYPNPAVDYIMTEVPGKSVITVSDLTGREILRLNASSKGLQRIDITRLPAGLYIIKAFLEDGSAYSNKFIVK